MATSLIKESKKGSRQVEKLTQQQQSFIKYLLADPKFDLTKAAKQSGYKTPSTAGNRLIKMKIIAAAVGNEIRLRSERLQWSADDVLMRLRVLLDVDLTELYDEEGCCNMASIKALPDVVRKCITKIKSFKKFTINDEGNKEYYDVYEVEWMSKDQALQLAMRHFGLLQPEVNVMVLGDEMKARVLVELLSQTNKADKISVVDGTVIDRLVHEG